MKNPTALAFLSLTLASVLGSGQALASNDAAPGTYVIDPAHSKVGFEVPHLVISSVDGRFNEFSGEIVIGAKPADSRVSVEIATQSVDTGIKKRDDHLRSPDFFDSAKFPKMTFKSKRVDGKPESFTAVGDLTIRGVTKEVKLDGKYLGSVKDGYGNLKAAFEARTKISRKEFGLTWNSLVEAGPVVGDEVTITLKVQAAKK